MCGYCQYVFYNYILLGISNDSLKLNETFLTTDRLVPLFLGL